MRAIQFIAILFLSLASASAVEAGIITAPTDLNPGDQYRLVFVTSTTRTAFSGSIGEYNDFVNQAANAVAELSTLGTTWTAIGSTKNIDARDNTGTNPLNSTGVAIYRLDDVRVANDNADLWDGTVINLINLTETMATASSLVFTGTASDGVGTGHFHVLGGDDQYVTFGITDDTPSRWVFAGPGQGVNQNAQLSLYGISGVLVVPGASVPEPASVTILGIGILGMLAVRRPRRFLRRISYCPSNV